ncbi:MAG: ABC transporter ATP-binding protein [Planctomycetota bacterium]
MALLEIRDLKKAYRSPEGELHSVLDVPELDLGANEELALRGASGSGKTTLLNVIAGILRPDSGRVLVGGADIAGMSESSRDALRARSIGYVCQTFNLLQGYSALENVLLGMMFGPGSDRAFATKLLGELGLSDRLNYRPGQLSVGQQQRVALARALANRPKLVLADEPTGNLDPTRAQEALDVIRRLCSEHGASLLLVSHDQAILDRFERSVELAEINRAASVAGGAA